MLKSVFVSSLTVLALIAPASAEPELKVHPAEIRQGQQLHVALSPDQAAGPFKLQVAGQTIEMFEQNDRFVCFVAMPADQKLGGYTLRVLDAQAKEVANQKIELRGVARSSQNIRFYTPNLTAAQQKQLDQEEALVAVAKASRTPEQLWQGAFSMPVPHRVSAVYGIRRYLNGKYNGYHSGTDFLTPMSYVLKAPTGAKVALARYFAPYNSNGNTVFLDHGLGVTSVYLHLSKILVKEGQMLKQGEPFALSGSTGRSTGPHLHWGVYLNGQNTDGLAWIKFSQNLAGL
jgi:murein DD-endopeptidase MepM/ murein hydrolase activator NlpD